MYLHGAFVDEHAIELDKGVICATWFIEYDRSNTTADTVGSVSEHGASHRSH